MKDEIMKLLIVATALFLLITLGLSFTPTPSAAADRSRSSRGPTISTKIASVKYYRMTGCMITMTNGKQYRGSTLTTGNSYHIWWTSVPKHGERQEIDSVNADRLSEALSFWEETNN